MSMERTDGRRRKVHTWTARCHTCGRFCALVNGSAWKLQYSGYPPEPAEELYRCKSCTDTHGGFTPQHGIVDKYSCGIFGK